VLLDAEEECLKLLGFAHLLSDVDYLKCAQDFACKYTQTEDLLLAMYKLLAMQNATPKKFVVTTLGKYGSTCALTSDPLAPLLANLLAGQEGSLLMRAHDTTINVNSDAIHVKSFADAKQHISNQPASAPLHFSFSPMGDIKSLSVIYCPAYAIPQESIVDTTGSCSAGHAQ
jgi:hypothetical protein